MSNSVDMESLPIPGPMPNYRYDTTKLDDFSDVTEITYATLVVDTSPSVTRFADDIQAMLCQIVDDCKMSSRADNIFLRVLFFNRTLNEIHGFKPLSAINKNDYVVRCSGVTALFDATYNAIGATKEECSRAGKDFDFTTNGCAYFLTDGWNNVDGATPAMIKEKLEQIERDEEIESMITVLIGFNAQNARKELENFKDEAGLTHFVDAGDVSGDSKVLGKLGGMISQSISSQAQAAGSGGPSQQILNF